MSDNPSSIYPLSDATNASDPYRIELDDVSLVFPLHSTARLTDGHNPKGVVPPVSDTGKLIMKRGRIRGVHALRNLSMTIHSGQRVGLIGANGSGKTSLLQVLAGILPPTKGTVKITGTPTSLINIRLGLTPNATGHRNILLRGLASGQTREEIEAKRDDIADFCELGDFLDLPVSTYSAGMRMRLNFAITTAFTPDILILDEWLSTGDKLFKRRASKRMQEFVGKAGILVLASHSPELLLENCDRGMWLSDGRVRMDGSMQEVLDAYNEETSAPINARNERTLPKRA
jgi:lipopolysaccharide transport system ATP-binding protein